jgi:hypothetical protein
MLVVGAVVLAAACGKSEEQKAAEKAAEQAAQGAQQAAQGAQQMAQNAQQGAQQMAQGMQQMAQALQGNNKAVEYEKLEAMLPQVSGWTRAEPDSEQNSAMGFTTSRTEVDYTNGDARMTLEIQDIALAQPMLAGLSMYTAAGFNERSSRGYKRATTIGGHPGFEEWTKDSQHAQVTAIVANRFIVTAKADDVADTAPARKLVEAVDLAKLATLK